MGAERQVQQYILKNYVRPSAEETDDRNFKMSPEGAQEECRPMESAVWWKGLLSSHRGGIPASAGYCQRPPKTESQDQLVNIQIGGSTLSSMSTEDAMNEDYDHRVG